jgi:prevent-host-death family protein
MIKVTATKFRNNLFGYLDKVAKGETIVIQRNRQEVARLISPPKPDWRDNIKVQPKLLVSPEEIIQPIDDIWEEYI